MTNTNTFIYLFVTIIFIKTFSIPVQATENKHCPVTDTMISVDVQNTPAKIIYKNGHSRSDIERQQLKRGRHLERGKWKILGLTQTEFKYTLKTTAKFKQADRGRYCAYPVSFNLDIGYENFTVYIDRKYRPGTCEYQAILKHENLHIAIYKRYLKRYIPYIKKQARAAAKAVQPVIISSPNQGTKHIQKQFQGLIRPLILKLNREADYSNAQIDTPESYRKLQLLCNNW